MGRSPWVVSKLGSIQQLRTEVIPKTTLKCVCVCVCVCVCLYLLLPSWSLSRNLHVFLPLYLLTASRRPIRLAPASPRRSGSGRGACAGQLSPLAWVRASVSLCACLWLVYSLTKVECLAGGVGAKGGLGSANGRG